MGEAFIVRRNGNTLPFRVFGGTTQPVSPKNGDIWVKTSTEIKQVDFVTSSWSGAAVGRTLIAGTLSGTAPSNANALTYVVSGKAHSIPSYARLNLTSCQQVQGSDGNWVNCDAYRYYGGTWVQFSSARQYLYAPGATHSDITGGWSSSGYSQGSGSPTGGGAVNAATLTATGSAGNYEGGIGTVNTVNLSPYKKLYVDCVSTTATNARIYVAGAKANFSGSLIAQGSISTTRSTVAINVSGITGSYYIIFTASSNNATTTVYNAWLE